MTPDEFRQLLTTKTDTDLLGPCLRDPMTPYVFDPDPGKWATFCTDVSGALSITPADIAVVGSGRFGFSLAPAKKLRAFTDGSDVDVIIVHAGLFDQLWHELLRAVYPRPPATSTVGGWLRERQKEVYTGWLTPLDVLALDKRIFGGRAQPVLDFRLRWFETFKQAERLITRRHEDLNTRLYRTWNHAEMYHLSSLSDLRKALSRAS